MKKALDKDLLAPILEALFEKYEAFHTNVNLTDRNNNLCVVSFKNTLLLYCSINSSGTLRNE